jgi:hypothetical protein
MKKKDAIIKAMKGFKIKIDWWNDNIPMFFYFKDGKFLSGGDTEINLEYLDDKANYQLFGVSKKKPGTLIFSDTR